MEHAKQWNTTFEFPAEAIAADAALLDSCGIDFTLMCQTKQSKLAHNRISVQRVLDTFGPQGTKVPGMMFPDFELLLEFARNGITPPSWSRFRTARQQFAAITTTLYDIETHCQQSTLQAMG